MIKKNIILYIFRFIYFVFGVTDYHCLFEMYFIVEQMLATLFSVAYLL
jgi:hypothetical protein